MEEKLWNFQHSQVEQQERSTHLSSKASSHISVKLI